MKPDWQSDCGTVRLWCRDCRDVMPTLSGVDAVVTDPPYGIGENAKSVASRANMAASTDYGVFHWDKQPASDKAIELILTVAKTSIIWGGNYFKLPQVVRGLCGTR